MGRYLDPGNGGFERIVRSGYVDKTGLIGEMNHRIGTTENLVCISRPRRFGKSYAAQVLCAYYDCTCDSHELFEGYEIEDSPDYETHINKYHVIYLDIAGFISDLNKQHIPLSQVMIRILDGIRNDLVSACPRLGAVEDVSDCLIAYVKEENRKVIFIIDEWDAVIREAKNDGLTQKAYLDFLRAWFKNGNFTPYVAAAAYMTGILPIKKDGSQSAISDFREYSVLDPGPFAVYTGFTEEEVAGLCEGKRLNFESAKQWYDGYTLGEIHSVYNPYSVICAMGNRRFGSYWKKTSAAEALTTYIKMDKEGLQNDIIRLIVGETIEVETGNFENDFETFNDKNDVLTLLVHLGYLAFEPYVDNEDNSVSTIGGLRIPNEEVRIEFKNILIKTEGDRIAGLRLFSDQLLEDTLAGREEEVARKIEAFRNMDYTGKDYNTESNLRYLIRFAYISCLNHYAKVEELPLGHGFADIAYLPKRGSALPAMVIELKWNKNVKAAIEQIRDRNYPEVLKSYGSEIVLVGISYNPKTKKHSCKIERM